MSPQQQTSQRRGAAAKVAVFLLIVLVWVALDQFTKSFFVGMEPGGILAGPFAGIFDIRLVHNTGGAWGIFSDSTFGLGLFSVIVCLGIGGFFLATAKNNTMPQAIAFGLIVAGGFGNAIDRFVQGYVTDFIEFSFFDFPVFNVADIGVTCGFAFLIIAMLLSWRNEGSEGGAE